MNSEKPQQPQSNFSDNFDSDEMEIDVEYEEITPEEQLKIRQQIKENTFDSEGLSEKIVDVWSEEEDSEEQPNILQKEETEEPLDDDSIQDVTELPEKNNEEKQEVKSVSATSNETEEQSDSNLEKQIQNIEDKPLPNLLAVEKPETEIPPKEEPETTEQQEEDNDVLSDLLAATEELETDNSNSSEQTNVSEKEPSSQPELIADSWLEESEKKGNYSEQKQQKHQELGAEITALEQQKANLIAEINNLKLQKETAIAEQTQEIADNLARMIQEGTRELKEQKNNLLIEIEKLEKRRQRIYQEMRTTFAGSSQELAVRIQGFKEYLVGSLQDLATAAERLDLPKAEPRRRTSQREDRGETQDRYPREQRRPRNSDMPGSSQPQFTEQTFAEQQRRIRQLLEQFRIKPDYYGSPWQLRRTFEPVHAARVQEWFFGQNGRGTIKGMGSRLQNILVASAIISVLYRLYRDRCRILVLVDTPEKLGEWRRGLQDCLGISRNDFGSNRGVMLFESPEVLVQRADRLLEDKLLPLIIIDEAEGSVNLSLLKFPLWLAFAEQPQSRTSGYLY